MHACSMEGFLIIMGIVMFMESANGMCVYMEEWKGSKGVIVFTLE